MGVGTLDLFHDEVVAYARRLGDSGGPWDLDIVPGAFHGFDLVFPKAEVSREFWRRQARALKDALQDRPGGSGLRLPARHGRAVIGSRNAYARPRREGDGLLAMVTDGWPGRCRAPSRRQLIAKDRSAGPPCR
ncbi:hypothetical protein AB0G67_17715 [Streptomyces sp. NPDC021056]|uniref:alpha/beta hydrolase n=1 Tax=Streptomyces sp. NPDC021056 TaxID=3155012 RepID=UPI0033CAD027